MKHIKGLLILMVFVCPRAFGADTRFDGTWKIDDARSTWSNGKFPKDMSLTIILKITDTQLIYHSVNDTNKEMPASSNYVAGLDGKPYPLPAHARYNQVRIRRISDLQFEILEEKDGDVIVGAIWTFSADGKHLMRWGVGKAPDGQSHAYTEYFDKQ